MRSVQAEMRSHRDRELSIPQFRALNFVNRCPEASLSQLADHLGVTLPSASKLVDGLVNGELITRCDSATDRRRLMLCLTRAGEDILCAARRATQDYLKETLRSLSSDELSTVIRAMILLQPLFPKET
jgi:DNA-binding MarR family transcriptional regulator